MNKKWKEYYSLLEDVEEYWYSKITSDIDKQEWQEALEKTRNNSAPGMSGITYSLLKKMGIKSKRILYTFAILCIRSGTIPTEWKKGILYPIPKSEFWNYNLYNVRPIMLLETIRKMTVRILNNRLSKVLKEKSILKGHNYAGLPGDSTSVPIHVLNNIIEEAREQKKELWILLQDMKKAFDSVSLDMLELTLKRIKIPANIRNFILDLYKDRKIEVVTAFGNSKEFTAEDRIDQEEVILPLVQHIFYDPLIRMIQEQEPLGYSIEVK